MAPHSFILEVCFYINCVDKPLNQWIHPLFSKKKKKKVDDIWQNNFESVL